MDIIKLRLLIAIASALLLFTAFAQEEALSLDELVVTGTRSASPLLEQAGNTGKISPDEIALVRPDHISDIINRVIGVNVQQGSGQEHLTSIRSPVLIGGAGAGSFLIYGRWYSVRCCGLC